MITAYTPTEAHLSAGALSSLSSETVWIDLLEPTDDEKKAIENQLDITIPTYDDMQEIEASSRLYLEDEALFMTASILSNADSNNPQGKAITFILSGSTLVTVRYATPLSFAGFIRQATHHRPHGPRPTADAVLSGLLETIIDRMADVMERTDADLNRISHSIFRTGTTGPDGAKKVNKPRNDLQEVLQAIGQNGDLSSKAMETLLGIDRMITFMAQNGDGLISTDIRLRAKTMMRDIHSLTDHAAFLSNKINFLLDATLGMINIEQNTIIKIFSVVAVVFLPPTLFASFYGMNFDLMPELKLDFGYPLALSLMIVSVFTPYLFFKRKGWL